MAGGSHICTHCYYEGKPVKPPSDAAGGDGEVSNAIARVANLLLPGVGFILRPLAMFVCLPIYLLLWLLRPWTNPKRHCQNCGLPLMVKKSSDAGEIAQRKLAVKMGKRFDAPEAPTLAFGKEMKLPDDAVKPVEQPKPRPEKLGSLDELLQDEPPPEPESAMKAPEQEITKPKKPVDPDQF